jgi:hypothetical protein
MNKRTDTNRLGQLQAVMALDHACHRAKVELNDTARSLLYLFQSCVTKRITSQPLGFIYSSVSAQAFHPAGL